MWFWLIGCLWDCGGWTAEVCSCLKWTALHHSSPRVIVCSAWPGMGTYLRLLRIVRCEGSLGQWTHARGLASSVFSLTSCLERGGVSAPSVHT